MKMPTAPTASFHLSLQAQRQELNMRFWADGQSELDWEGWKEWGRFKVKLEVISPMSILSVKKGGLALLPASSPSDILCPPQLIKRYVPFPGLISPDFSTSSHPIKMPVFKVQKNIQIVPM